MPYEGDFFVHGDGWIFYRGKAFVFQVGCFGCTHAVCFGPSDEAILGLDFQPVCLLLKDGDLFALEQVCDDGAFDAVFVPDCGFFPGVGGLGLPPFGLYEDMSGVRIVDAGDVGVLGQE